MSAPQAPPAAYQGAPPAAYGYPEAQNQEKGQHDQFPPQQPITGQPVPQVLVQQVPQVSPLSSLQQEPRVVDCPRCHAQAMTNTEYVSGNTTTVSAILCCCVTCLGCIPYLMTWAKDCEHKCGSCGSLLAVWHRSGKTIVVAQK